MTSRNNKQIPSSIGIFGASGHIGRPMADWLRYHSPHTRLRLITSDQAKVEALAAAYPKSEVAVGNYFDPSSLERAVAGVEGLFVVTTTATDEAAAMTNLVAAVRRASGDLVHLIRLVGEFPVRNPRHIPQTLLDYGLGLEVQHPIARHILDDSGLPVTYFNIGASFMDNLLKPAIYSLGARSIVWPNRRVPLIDPREIGEAAARVLLSDNHRHINQFHTLNNGCDNLTMAEIVDMVSDVLRLDVAYDSSRESFLEIMSYGVAHGHVPAGMPEYLLNFFEYEDDNDVCWSLNDALEQILGRKPAGLRSWIQEHRKVLLDRLGAADP